MKVSPRDRALPADTFRAVECLTSKPGRRKDGMAAAVSTVGREVPVSVHIPSLAIGRRVVLLLAGLAAVASTF